MPKQDENVLDLDALIGDVPVVKYKGKDYKIDPAMEDMMRVAGTMTKGHQINSEQMRQLILAMVPDFNLDGMTNLQLLPIFMFLTKQINKAMGVELPELKDIAEGETPTVPFAEKQPTGAS